MDGGTGQDERGGGVRTTVARSSQWIVPSRKNGSLRLFCIPYAGGGPSVFRSWSEHLPVDVEVCAVHVPGRETRVNEPAIGDLMCLVRELSKAIEPYLDLPYALFGHSVGGLVSFELARELRRRYGVEPFHLFISGCPAPQLRETDPMYDLPEAEFLARLQQLNGTPPEVMSHPELMALMVPTLRADFSLRDTYRYHGEPPLTCPISAFGGTQDADVGHEKLEGWREHTTARFHVRLFQGNHFFLRTAQEPVLETLTASLNYAREVAVPTQSCSTRSMSAEQVS
ncbi:MAG: thioesterase [Nitrospira sp.]|nr:thioesterase [Nitrospira sp.]